ncbi:MAG: hypothetical protein ACR2K0_06220 [Acidimicrobiales bacterium]
MAITVARGTLARFVKYPGSIVVQVQHASDPEAAAAALSDAVADLRALDPNHVGEVVVAPSGPFLFVDAAKVSERLVRTSPTSWPAAWPRPG